MRIGIAGAGIGGLAAAAALHDGGHEVIVHDRFDAPRPVGSGLVIQPVGQDALATVGCLDGARALGTPIARMLGHHAGTGRRVLDVAYDRGGTGHHGLGIHRGALFDVLWRAVAARGIAVVPGFAAVEAPMAGDRRGLRAADGRVAGPFDLVVDAAGAGSPLSPIRTRTLRFGAVWGTVDWPDATPLPRDRLSQVYRRADRMVGVLPIGRMPGGDRDLAAVFWSLPVDSVAAWRDGGIAAWRTEATGLWPEIAPFVAQIGSCDDLTVARYGHGTLRRPYAPALVHIGDAAHRASPQLGQGANMALLDAVSLARAIAVADGQDPLALHAAARNAHVRVYQAFSAAFTPMYQSHNRILPILRDRILFPMSQVPPAPRILTALVRGTMLPPMASLQRGASSGRNNPGGKP